MKKISLARQHFEQLIGDGCIYVDKTPLIAQLVEEYQQVFLARPRRFGKSLLLSTLANLFSGKKDLFKGLWMENNWDWEDTSPVIHFYMDKTNFKSLGIEQGLHKHLDELGKEHQVLLSSSTSDMKLEELLKKVVEKTGKQVVLLFDEYDKPINEYLNQPEIAEQHREILSNFYGVLKPNSDNIRFLMLTGVSKFSHVSFGPNLNQLSDITFSKDFHSLLGYTQTEIELYFAPYLERAARELPLSYPDLLAQLKHWYNGYSWDGDTFFYNPVSVMRFLKERRFQNYWFTTGTPRFLVEQLQERAYTQFDGLEVGQNVLESLSLKKIGLPALLIQTGYLTVKESLPNQIFRLGYPNHEVRMSMLDNLMGAFGRTDVITPVGSRATAKTGTPH